MFSQQHTTASEGSDPQFNSVTMLLHGDGTNGGQNNTFLDSSTNNLTITRSGNTTQGSFSPYGPNWSNYFDGTGDYLKSASSSAFAFGTGDFTMEAWIYPVSVSGTQGVVSTRVDAGAGSNQSFFGIDTGTVLYYGGVLLANGGTVRVNEWAHIACSRSSGTIRLFLNGTQVATGSDTADKTTTFGYIGAGGGDNAQLFAGGYISNARFVKGTAVYTANFTPSTTPLTAVSGTSLLTCQSNRFIDNSSNNFAITRNGDVSVQRFSPFAPPAAYSTATIGGSGYFDGTGDFLTVPANTALNLSTGDFTIEMWVNPFAYTTYQTWIANGSGVSARFGLDGSSVILYSGSTIFSYGTRPVLGAWTHYALVRSGTSIALFENGTRVATATSSAAVDFSSGGTKVGSGWDTGADMRGYLSNVRVVKGTAVYSPAATTITVPTAPVTAITNTSLLTNFTNAAIFDNAMMNDLETVGNAQISTSVVKYGTGSLAFDGTGDWLTIPKSPNLALGTTNFTVECWVYVTRTTNNYGRLFWFEINNNGTSGSGLSVEVYSNSGGVFNLNTGAGQVGANSTDYGRNWHHIAVVRYNGTTKLYVNGIATNAGLSDSTNYTASIGPIVGGAYYNGSIGNELLQGYIDDFRITKGVARYTANFTPPTAAFPNQ